MRPADASSAIKVWQALSYLKRIAPTEQAFLESEVFLEDLDHELEDGSWSHLGSESDRITEDDLRRFHAYEAVMRYQYHVEVTTCLLCSSTVESLKSILYQGITTYRVQIVQMKDKDADAGRAQMFL